jgi:hypothetical protein
MSDPIAADGDISHAADRDPNGRKLTSEGVSPSVLKRCLT